ncbi:uncharacterized protein LOC115755147 isoform X2 [Rhodamnia argentea]|uniref:Uncharacterized protein LOC115755147 isoform X2 n=1 Tax=Rhodamnia argentea TaxID=178133 RepID=A0ABM3HF96_9MYRT|nr:uncharacterized protein LOC115755147 isoform X2 [Rhodamnia argentea]
MELGERLKFKMLITRFLRVFWVDSSSKTFRKNKERLLAQRRTEQSKLRVKHSELVFRGPAPPKPLTTPEVASEFDSEHPFFKVVTQQDHESKVDFPGQFAWQHIQENKEIATLRFSYRSGPVKLLSSMHEIQVFFAAGWPVFAKLICVWEISVFELIGTSPFSLVPVRSRFAASYKSRIPNYASFAQ